MILYFKKKKKETQQFALTTQEQRARRIDIQTAPKEIPPLFLEWMITSIDKHIIQACVKVAVCVNQFHL